ncbi:MAG TPA: hypothetical protein VM577_01545 [Anaerovoracaceae bacterium]|nr:hypothetical protein [Anaerovoracaceae bacterium]
MRGINDRFINDLKNGPLLFFLSQARNNPSICLEVRKDYINLYYKGGRALKIIQNKRSYSFYFDSKYCLNKGNDKNFEYFNSLNHSDCKSFIDSFPLILEEMDSWFKCNPKPEREFQHNLIKKNQKQLIVTDIEYAGKTNDKGFRLDMIGLNRSEAGYQVIIFENKFGTGAISGKAGIGKHYLDIVNILSNPEVREDLISSVVNIANNKTELGLIELPMKKQEIKDVEILFLIAGFNEKSRSLANEVNSIHKSLPARVCIVKPEETALDYSMAKDLFTY